MEKVEQKIKDLSAAVTDRKGSVLVIGLMGGVSEDEKVVIAAVNGNGSQLVEAISKIVSNKESAAVADILKAGISAGAFLKFVENQK